MKCIILLFLLFFPFSIYPQWTNRNPVQNGENLYCSEYIDENNIWVVGEAGTIIHSTNGGASWIKHSTGINEDFNSVSFKDWPNGVIVGNAGSIIFTTNAGNDLNSGNYSGTGNLHRVIHLQNNEYLAVGDNGIILKTTNGGSDWLEKPSMLTTNLYALYLDKNNVLWTSGELGKLQCSSDFGESWYLMPDIKANYMTTGTRINTITAKGNFYYAKGSFNYLTWDEGLTWYEEPKSYSGVIYDSDTTEQYVWEVGIDYDHLFSLGSMNPIPPDILITSDYLYDIEFLNDSSCIITGNNGTILKDGSNSSWQTILSGSNYDLTSIYFLDDSTGWIFSQFNNNYDAWDIVYKTFDGGLSWKEISNSNIYNDDFDKSNFIYFVNESLGFLGIDGEVYRSTDSGQNWTLVIQYIPHEESSVDFIDESNGYAIVFDKFYLSTDGGVNWTGTILNGYEDTKFSRIKFFNSNTGYIIGDSLGTGVILKTTDGGLNWRNMGTIGIPAEFHFFNENIIYAVAGWGMFIKTFNGFEDYEISSIFDVQFKSISFKDLNNGTIVSDAIIFTTTNGGGNWINTSMNGMNKVTYTPNGNGWMIGDEGQLMFYDKDDPPLPVELVKLDASVEGNNVILNWETSAEVNNYGFEIQRAENLQGFKNLGGFMLIGFVNGAGNSPGPKHYSFTDNNLTSYSHSYSLIYRLKQIDLDGNFKYSEPVEVIIQNMPDKFVLEQNYPNPFNPVTTIKYFLPVGRQASQSAGARSIVPVRLLIYNMLGQEVAVLVNEPQPPGNYEVKFNASGLSSGIYFYKLQAGSFSDVKKLLLMK